MIVYIPTLVLGLPLVPTTTPDKYKDKTLSKAGAKELSSALLISDTCELG